MRHDFSISLIRVCAMTLVVLYHSYCCYTNVWHSIRLDIRNIDFYTVINFLWNYIHVPLFFMVSGFLYGRLKEKYIKLDNRSYILMKFKRLIIPYLFWSVVLLFLGKVPMTILTGISHLWFLLVLFEIIILFHYMYKYSIWKKKYTIIFFVILYLIESKISIFQYLCIGNAIEYIPYYVLGFILTFNNTIFKRIANYRTFFIILCLIIIYIILHCHQIKYARFMLPISIMSMILCVNIFCLIKLNANRIKNKTTIYFVEMLSSLSMGIYIIHHIIIQEVLYIPLFHIIAYNHYIIYPISMFLISYILSASITIILMKTPFRVFM